jgi:ribosomal protein L16 Arg81 hydroxylase
MPALAASEIQHRSSLARLLAPTTLDGFFAEYWEKAPLRTSHPAGDFSEMFRLEDVDHLLSLPGLVGSEFFRLLNRHAPGDVLTFEAGANTLSLAQIYHAFEQGSTINVLGLHRFWPTVAALCRDLEDTLHHRIYCNLFLTPPNAPPLHSHYDDQDVLILQLSGSKMWRIDEHPFPLPLRGDFADVPLSDQVREIILHEGDVLYLPRGFIHEPTVLDSTSLHLTVGITPHRWVDVLSSALIVNSQRTLSLRRALPAGVLFNPARHHELEKPFHDLIAECLGSFSLTEAVDHLSAGSLGEMHPLPTEHFNHLMNRDHTTEETLVARRPGMLCQVRFLDGRVAIQFPGNQVFGPPSIAPALEFIAAAREAFAVGDLPGLSPGSRITLVRQLVLEGLLRFV